MATFPNELKPVFVENNELIRLGSIDDGGYVVPLKSIKNSKSLVSFGISDNWDFEKDFTKKGNVNLYAYDHSVDKSFWSARFKKDLLKFFKLKIFLSMPEIQRPSISHPADGTLVISILPLAPTNLISQLDFIRSEKFTR